MAKSTERLLLLCLVVDKEINGFGQWAVLVPKLCKVEPSGRKDKLNMPDIRVSVRVPSINGRAFTGTGLRLGQ